MAKKWGLITNAMMMIYAVLLIVLFIQLGFLIPAVLLFIINMANLLLSQFAKTTEFLISIVCIFVGFMAYFLLQGIVSVFGIIFGIYGIVLTIALILDIVNE